MISRPTDSPSSCAVEGRRVAIIECGAGSAVPTVRITCERLAAVSDNATLIRINLRESFVPSGHVALELGMLDVLRLLEAAWRHKRGGTMCLRILQSPMSKSSVDEIRRRFDTDVERFSNLETGQSATMDAPLVLELITSAAAATNPPRARRARRRLRRGQLHAQAAREAAGLERRR